MWINYFNYIFLPFSQSRGGVIVSRGMQNYNIYCKPCISVSVCPLYFMPWAQIFTGSPLPCMLLVLCHVKWQGPPSAQATREAAATAKGWAPLCQQHRLMWSARSRRTRGCLTSDKRITAHAGEQPGWQETQLPSCHSVPSCWCFPLNRFP